MSTKAEITPFRGSGNLRLHIPEWAEIPDADIQSWSPDPDSADYPATIEFAPGGADPDKWFAQLVVDAPWMSPNAWRALRFEYDAKEDCLINTQPMQIGGGWRLDTMRIYRGEAPVTSGPPVFIDILTWKRGADVFVTAYIWPH